MRHSFPDMELRVSTRRFDTPDARSNGCVRAVFRKGIQNFPVCSRGLAISTPGRNVLGWHEGQQFCRRFRFCAL